MVTQLYLTEGGRMKSFSIFLCSLLMVACAGGLGGGWKGKHRDDLIKHYGSPVKETVLPGGGKELLYEENHTAIKKQDLTPLLEMRGFPQMHAMGK